MPLAEEIVANGGMLLTEMPLGWEPRARDFPRRNRLVSGMSLGVVVVEAAKRSGSLITARLALEQDREVFAVPGSPLDPRAEGGNALIQQGARLITGAADIIEALVSRRPVARRAARARLGRRTPAATGRRTAIRERSRDGCSSLLSVTPVPVDELIAQTGLSVDRDADAAARARPRRSARMGERATGRAAQLTQRPRPGTAG